MKRTTLLATALVTSMLMPSLASAQSARELRHDRQEIRHDQARGDHREAREDRREYREDWRDYRKSHASVYRRSAYAGPRGYRYHPVAAGHRFAPDYYARRYWIGDYARYRLARPGTHQRWVRYGNDVVLVDIRNGHTLRVYNRFFW